MNNMPLREATKAQLASLQKFLIESLPCNNSFWDGLISHKVVTPQWVFDVRNTVGSCPSDHTRMLLDVIRRGSVEMLNGFLKALWDTNNGHIANVIEGKTEDEFNPEVPSTRLEQGMRLHKKNWAKSLLVVPAFGFGRGTTDVSKLYVPLYLIHNKDDQTDLNPAEVRSTRMIPTDMIFQNYDGSPAPNTVLIEGAPGNGKTTFTMAYMYDWCVSRSKLENGHTATPLGLQGPQGNPPWKLILYVPVTKITSSVEDAVMAALAVSKPYKSEMAELLELYPDNCAVILDGIDECRDDKIRRQLSEYIEQSKMGQRPRVIVTARTYLCGVDAVLFDRHLKCEGFTKAQAEAYIDLFFVNDKCKVEEIKQKVSLVDDSLTNPLRLYMMCLGIKKGMIDISSCDRLTSTVLYRSQEQLLMLRELKKPDPDHSFPPDKLKSELRKFALLSLSAMLQGRRSLTDEMIHGYGIENNSPVRVFLKKEDILTCWGEVERWMYLHETLYEYLSARGLQFLGGESRHAVLLYICAKQEFRNTMLLFIGLLGQKENEESQEDTQNKENIIEEMLKVCLVLQGLLDKQGLPEKQRSEVRTIKQHVSDLVQDELMASLMEKLCTPIANPELCQSEDTLKRKLARQWSQVIQTFYDSVMRYPESVFFGMMEEERYCGIIRHIVDCLRECGKSHLKSLNVIQWVIPGHWCGKDGHGSPLAKDVFAVGDGRWVIVSYGIWQYGRARVFDAWCPEDAIFAWKKHQKSSREQEMEDRQKLQKEQCRIQNEQSGKQSKSSHEVTHIKIIQESVLCKKNTSFQSLEFRMPSPRESFRVWGNKGQAPDSYFGYQPWTDFFSTVIRPGDTTREFHLYLAAETPLVPLLEVVLERLNDLRSVVMVEMEIWGGHITEMELVKWLARYRVVRPFELMQLRGIDVVTSDDVEIVLGRFGSEKVLDQDTLSCRRPVHLE